MAQLQHRAKWRRTHGATTNGPIEAVCSAKSFLLACPTNQTATQDLREKTEPENNLINAITKLNFNSRGVALIQARNLIEFRAFSFWLKLPLLWWHQPERRFLFLQGMNLSASSQPGFKLALMDWRYEK